MSGGGCEVTDHDNLCLVGLLRAGTEPARALMLALKSLAGALIPGRIMPVAVG